MKGNGTWIVEERGNEIEGGMIEVEEITTEEMKEGKDGAIEGEMIEITVMNYEVIGEFTGSVRTQVQQPKKNEVKPHNQMQCNTILVSILVYPRWIRRYILRDRQRERERRRDRDDRRRGDRRNDGDREKRHSDGRDRNDRYRAHTASGNQGKLEGIFPVREK